MIKHWRQQAACAGMPTDMFFPHANDRTGLEAALAVCAGCPVTTLCAEFAATNPGTVGIWGGQAEDARIGREPNGRRTRKTVPDPHGKELSGRWALYRKQAERAS